MNASPRRTTIAVVAVLALLMAPLLATSNAEEAPESAAEALVAAALDQAITEQGSLAEPEPSTVVRLRLPGSAELDAEVDAGLDVAGNLERTTDGLEVDAVVTADEIGELQSRGVTILPAGLPQEADLGTAGDAAAANDEVTALATDTVRVGRVDHFTTKGQGFISVEAKTSEGDDSSVTLDLAWDAGPGTAPGSGGTQRMGRFFDSGVYMYHRILLPVDARPETVTVTSSAGGEDSGYVSDWLYEVDALTDGRGYQSDFVDGYRYPTQLFDRMEELADAYPDITELVDLPYDTNGYQRKAQALFEPPPALVTVLDGPAAGGYEFAQASFGPTAPAAGITGPLAVANDGSEDPTEGCAPLVGFPAGAIALVDRGSCNFTTKTLNAQAAGAIAVLIVNDRGGNPTSPGGNAPGITIPTVMVSQDEAGLLKASLPAAATVPPPVAAADSAVVVTSEAWGHEGGNDLTVEMVDPGTSSSPLGVSVDDDAITVSLGTDADGELASTAAEVVEALKSQAGDLVYSHTYRGNEGAGVVAPAEPVQLTDFLSAPSDVERGPFAMRALRVGENRDGSKPGVLVVAQDHAREWVPPVIVLETMERLLANSRRDAETRRILRDVDIFLIPSNNPDGSHYSFFDENFQRRNMTNHCDDTGSDPGRRHDWGVDLNRNYRVGSAADGYTGASFNCLSDTYMGPDKLSEPEAKNVVHLAEEHPNIKFFMTVHSNGGQLFWQPGAYIAQGRITTPRPEMRDEAFYWQSAERILSHVKAHQDTVVRPDNVGGSADVLYSSAGNVREDLYNNYGIYAFGWEVGGSVWDPEDERWVGGSFQPDWEERGHGEMMEYANGVMEMFRIAADWGRDHRGPRAQLHSDEAADGTVEVTFTTSEPATVYYTTDGNAPTFDSSRYQAEGIREGGETITVTDTTTFHWFSVDAAGNLERGYDPDRGSRSYGRATVRVD